MSDELVRAMIIVPSQPDFESYCSIIKETDDRLRVYKARVLRSKDQATPGASRPTWKRPMDAIQPGADSKNSNGPKVVRKASVESMDWEPTPIKVAAMSTKRAKWVTQEERDNRRRTGHYIRYRATGYIIYEYPYRPS